MQKTTKTTLDYALTDLRHGFQEKHGPRVTITLSPNTIGMSETYSVDLSLKRSDGVEHRVALNSLDNKHSAHALARLLVKACDTNVALVDEVAAFLRGYAEHGAWDIGNSAGEEYAARQRELACKEVANLFEGMSDREVFDV